MRPFRKHFCLVTCCMAFLAGSCGPRTPSAGELVGSSGEESSAFLLGPKRTGDYLIGGGTGDITGPMVGLETMGYAAPAPKTNGLHQRLWARAFVVADKTRPDNRLAMVVADLCFVSGAVKAAVVQKLNDEFGSIYDHSNVMLTATHTHSGPGAYSSHHMYNLPSGGFSEENFDIIVQGIVDAIVKADTSLEPGFLSLASGSLSGLSRNRSLFAYEQNPDDERASYDSSTDQDVTLLRFDGESGEPLGLVHWFAVHATSINKENGLISGDNKGYAAWRFEREMGRVFGAENGFVAAFANSNAGDASPNVAGDVDGDGDWECAANENFACAEWSGEGHYNSAQDLFNQATQPMQGPLLKAHRFVDFSDLIIDSVEASLDDAATTCASAIGISMLAGSAEDGPGVGQEGTSCQTGGLIARRRCTRARFACHGEKPVALATGSLGNPTWTPNVLPTQIFVLGKLALVAVPSEMTTMAGRRLREHLRHSLADVGVEHIVIAGYSNAYANYVATREEYQVQHYEGASTLFGEWTLDAYQMVYQQLAKSFSGVDAPVYEQQPEFFTPRRRAELVMGVDRLPRGRAFGEAVAQPAATYAKLQTVAATFQGANLNHSLEQKTSLLEIQHLQAGEWTTVAYDADYSTRLYWQDNRFGTSTVRIEWDIPGDAASGQYRVLYRAKAKSSSAGLEPFEGLSTIFTVD